MKIYHIIILLTAVIFIQQAASYPTYEGCPDLQNSDFVQRPVIAKTNLNNPVLVDATLDQPIDFAFDPVYDNNNNMHVDIYFIERGERQGTEPGNDRKGKLKRFDAINNTITTLGEWDVMVWDPTKENGMTGIALDPDFKENRWVYLQYSTPEGPQNSWTENLFRIARFTLKDDYTVDYNSRKILLDIPINFTGCCHSGGPLNFDHYGDLWIGTGDQADYRCTNTEGTDGVAYRGCFQTDDESKRRHSAEWGAACTKSLLGAYLRIHPDDNDPRGYTIPEGNFGEYWGDYYEAQGDLTRAAEFRDTSKVLPEIYAKGARNPYAMRLDPVRRWVMDGNCGPDGPRTDDISANMHSGPTEEFNLLTHPSFLGWPYMSGPHIWHDEEKDPDNPLNDSPFNNGIELMPPIEPAIYGYQRQCAMTGPIYRYDPDLDSDIKLPPHFDRKWFVTDFNQSWMKVFTLNDDGTKIINEEDPAFPGKSFNKPLAMDIGPDGALYINNYSGYNTTNQNTRISRIEYTGDCRPDRAAFSGTFEKVGCTDENYEEYDEFATHMLPGSCQTLSVGKKPRILKGVELSSSGIIITSNGEHTIRLLDVSGKEVRVITGRNSSRYMFSEIKSSGITSGVYIIDVTTADGSMVVKRPVF